MTSLTSTVWCLTQTTSPVVHPMCAEQAANTTKVYFRGLCIDGDDGP
ncbi:MAG: hypothetical protein HY718_04485 [Planctomycetes bacterium]|nr:hypothetical protein [Planctomycetota bacterium]